jgi:hypothetical protein
VEQQLPITSLARAAKSRGKKFSLFSLFLFLILQNGTMNLFLTISSQIHFMGSQFKPITISARMPKNVAKVARVLNALKLSPDQSSSSDLLPGEGTSLCGLRAAFLVTQLEKLVGSLDGKRIADIGCGPVDENKQTALLRCLRDMGISPSYYIGIDPVISPTYSDNQKTPACEAIFLPASIYGLNLDFLDSHGKMDQVISSMFFGSPLIVSTFQMLMRIERATFTMPESEFMSFPARSDLKAIMASHRENPHDGGFMRDFLEYMVHEQSLKMLGNDGDIAHFILIGEEEPKIEIAQAAGLELKERKKVGDEGTIFCFTPQS